MQKCKNAKRAHMQNVTKQNLLTILYIGCKHIICKAKMQKLLFDGKFC